MATLHSCLGSMTISIRFSNEHLSLVSLRHSFSIIVSSTILGTDSHLVSTTSLHSSLETSLHLVMGTSSYTVSYTVRHSFEEVVEHLVTFSNLTEGISTSSHFMEGSFLQGGLNDGDTEG